MSKRLLILATATLLNASSAPAKLLDPSAPSALPAVSAPLQQAMVPTPQAAVEPPEEFAIPVDEMHATGSFTGQRLLTGTRDGEFAAFSIKKGAAGYEVVELTHSEVAWQLGKVVFGWTVVATLLFTALFAIAGKSRSSVRRKK